MSITTKRFQRMRIFFVCCGASSWRWGAIFLPHHAYKDVVILSLRVYNILSV